MENLKVTSRNRDNILRGYGFTRLTGEACGVGMRVLYDLNEMAARIMSNMLGGWEGKAPAWNTGETSIMLPQEWMDEIEIYALLTEYEVVISGVFKNEIKGLSTGIHVLCYYSQEDWREGKDNIDTKNWTWKVYQRQGTSEDGMRNVHGWTGRVV